MSAKQYILLLLVVVGVVSCKKDPIEIPVSNDPVFLAEGTFNGESFQLIAGDDGAYMHTMTHQENGVSVFSGNISDGSMSIELGIYDGVLDIQGQSIENFLPALDSILFSYYVDQTLVVLSKDLLVGISGAQNIAQVDWSINGGPSMENYAYIDEPGRYMVKAVVYFDYPGEPFPIPQEYYNELIVGYSHQEFSIDLWNAGQGYFSGEVSSNVPPTETNWFVDGNYIGTANSVPTTSTDSVHSGMHVVTAEAHFPNGSVRDRSFVLSGSNFSTNPLVAHDLGIFEEIGDSTWINAGQTYRDFNIRLRITKAGVLYSSEYVNNASTVSSIQITGFEYYGQNSAGKDVYKVSAIISAYVSDAVGGNPIPIQFNTVFGFEIP